MEGLFGSGNVPKHTKPTHMSCVVHGCLVEMLNGYDSYRVPLVHLTPIQEIAKGDYVMDPLNNVPKRVVDVLRYETGGMWPLHTFLGLRADAAQWIWYPPTQELTRLTQTSASSTEMCDAIFALVLENGKYARIDGVVCCTHSITDVV